jgi:hypothetical protein
VGPRIGLDAVEKEKFLILLGLEFRPHCRLAGNQSLYQLLYPGFRFRILEFGIFNDLGAAQMLTFLLIKLLKALFVTTSVHRLYAVIFV